MRTNSRIYIYIYICTELHKIKDFYHCTVHFDIYLVHSPPNALFINLFKSFKFTLKYTIISRSDIIVYFNVNLKLLTKLINSEFVSV